MFGETREERERREERAEMRGDVDDEMDYDYNAEFADDEEGGVVLGEEEGIRCRQM